MKNNGASMTREDFEKQYASSIGSSEDDPDLHAKLFRHGYYAMTCDCGEGGCKGWQMRMMPPDPDILAEAMGKAAFAYGQELARRHNDAFWNAFIGKEKS